MNALELKVDDARIALTNLGDNLAIMANRAAKTDLKSMVDLARRNQLAREALQNALEDLEEVDRLLIELASK